MQRGDIQLFVATYDSSPLDKTIASIQWLMGYRGGLYYHVEIIAGKGMSYAARWPRTDLYPSNLNRPYEIYRINSTTPEMIEKGMAWLEANAGERYDWPALITAGWIQLVHEQICSTYGAGYVENTGMAKGPFPKCVKPDQMLSLAAMTFIESGGG
jgi:hypothetical protein